MFLGSNGIIDVWQIDNIAQFTDPSEELNKIREFKISELSKVHESSHFHLFAVSKSLLAILGPSKDNDCK